MFNACRDFPRRWNTKKWQPQRALQGSRCLLGTKIHAVVELILWLPPVTAVVRGSNHPPSAFFAFAHIYSRSDDQRHVTQFSGVALCAPSQKKYQHLRFHTVLSACISLYLVSIASTLSIHCIGPSSINQPTTNTSSGITCATPFAGKRIAPMNLQLPPPL